MAVLHVAQLGHPVLRLVAQAVDPELIPTEAFQGFLDDMQGFGSDIYTSCTLQTYRKQQISSNRRPKVSQQNKGKARGEVSW